mmetsp:Transcript_8947/g.36561  ORF Transcript_8947/g.36561 Transcript_8947/m.36561 type:complete len:302 (+) Transcript_8947:770-1675(+)
MGSRPGPSRGGHHHVRFRGEPRQGQAAPRGRRAGAHGSHPRRARHDALPRQRTPAGVRRDERHGRPARFAVAALLRRRRRLRSARRGALPQTGRSDQRQASAPRQIARRGGPPRAQGRGRARRGVQPEAVPPRADGPHDGDARPGRGAGLQPSAGAGVFRFGAARAAAASHPRICVFVARAGVAPVLPAQAAGGPQPPRVAAAAKAAHRGAQVSRAVTARRRAHRDCPAAVPRDAEAAAGAPARLPRVSVRSPLQPLRRHPAELHPDAKPGAQRVPAEHATPRSVHPEPQGGPTPGDHAVA